MMALLTVSFVQTRQMNPMKDVCMRSLLFTTCAAFEFELYICTRELSPYFERIDRKQWL